MIIVFSTYPDRKSADAAASMLVEKRLAACVSIMRIEQSVYRWNKKVEKCPEWLLMIKTAKRAYPSLERYIKRTHPHRVPEIIYVDVEKGLPSYLRWLESSVSKALRVPLDRPAMRRTSRSPKELTKARKPKTSSR